MKCEVCGCDNKDKGTRSYEQLKRFFAVRSAYFQHWPERHEFQPDCEEHLRAWVLVKAGHFHVETIDPQAAEKFTSIKQKGDAGSFSFVFARGGKIAIYSPKSVKYKKLKHIDACRLFEVCDEIFEAETGLKANQVLKETENAA